MYTISHIKFLESILESLPQLGLSIYILHHHGLDENYIFFEGDVQILTAISSLISILVSISYRQAFMKNLERGDLEEPTIKQTVKYLLFTIIPITGAVIATFIMLSKTKYVAYIFLFLYVLTQINYLFPRFLRSIKFFCKREYQDENNPSFSQIFSAYFQTLSNYSHRHLQKPWLKFITFNRVLILLTLVTAIIHTIQCSMGTDTLNR